MFTVLPAQAVLSACLRMSAEQPADAVGLLNKHGDRWHFFVLVQTVDHHNLHGIQGNGYEKRCFYPHTHVLREFFLLTLTRHCSLEVQMEVWSTS